MYSNKWLHGYFFQQGHSLGLTDLNQCSGLKISRILSTSPIAEWTGCVECFLTNCMEAESALVPRLCLSLCLSFNLSLPADYRSHVDLGCGAIKLCVVGAGRKSFSTTQSTTFLAPATVVFPFTTCPVSNIPSVSAQSKTTKLRCGTSHVFVAEWFYNVTKCTNPELRFKKIKNNTNGNFACRLNTNTELTEVY